jgi:hypothetical protein
MNNEDLRRAIKMDAQACEELTIGDDPLTPESVDEIIERATKLLQNSKLYRAALRRG